MATTERSPLVEVHLYFDDQNVNSLCSYHYHLYTLSAACVHSVFQQFWAHANFYRVFSE